MTLFVLFVATSVIFLALDAAMLSTIMHPLFQRHLGESLLDGLRLVPAALFYLLYMGGVLHFASLPALRSDAPTEALINGVLLGLFAYGTYELTSYAVMRDWHWSMAAVDMTWGAVLTGVSAWGGVMVARALS
ncbi:DUF2177 family protein [Tropicimonas isoalkanivorans]|uniref:Uncharacterized membrane protein n=1 Tax=Tropicimonas isoalkanivorans TaxID=441112 RepID=A0A1I1GKL3_9RHOB|nr:DUF2177 family protein [Tropicimonas isoalkanivorans]SFC11996.1 Uncharacterized membrane protein [Tropicimonas isoalkanivorans]